MEGLLFIWLSWIAIIIIVFFLQPKVPMVIVYHLLIIICLSSYQIPYVFGDVTWSSVYITLITIFYIGKEAFKTKINIVCISFIMALCKATYDIFSAVEPLWFMLLPSWFSGVILFYLSLLMMDSNRHRMQSLVMGMVISECFIYFAFTKSGLSYSLFNLIWLDHLAFVCMLMSAWSSIQFISKYFSDSTKQIHKKEV